MSTEHVHIRILIQKVITWIFQSLSKFINISYHIESRIVQNHLLESVNSQQNSRYNKNLNHFRDPQVCVVILVSFATRNSLISPIVTVTKDATVV